MPVLGRVCWFVRYVIRSDFSKSDTVYLASVTNLTIGQHYVNFVFLCATSYGELKIVKYDFRQIQDGGLSEVCSLHSLCVFF